MANINKTSDTYVYFLYSETQVNERSAIEKKMSKTFNPGMVVVNGRRQIFSELSKKSSNRYADCKIVAQGLKSKMTYTMPSTS